MNLSKNDNSISSINEKTYENCKRILEYFDTEPNNLNLLSLHSFKKRNNPRLQKLKAPSDLVQEFKAKLEISKSLKTMTDYFSTDKQTLSSRSNQSLRNKDSSLSLSVKRMKLSSKPKIKFKDVSSAMPIEDLARKLYTHSNPIGNKILTNLTQCLLATNKDLYDKLKSYLSQKEDNLSSENKQIKYFLIILEKLKQTTECSKSDQNSNKSLINLLDSITLDFCNHLKLNSIFRAEFVKELSKFKDMVYKENATLADKEIINLKKELHSLKEDNEELIRTNENNLKKIKLLKTELGIANETATSMRNDLKDKVDSIKQLNMIIKSRENELLQRDQMIANLNLKINMRGRPSFTGEEDFQILKYTPTLITNQEKEFADLSYNPRENVTSRYKSNNTGTGLGDKLNQFKETTMINDKTALKMNFQERLTKRKANLENFDYRHRIIFEDSVLNINNPVKEKDKVRKQLRLESYLNKGANSNGKQKDSYAQTEITSTYNPADITTVENICDTISSHIEIVHSTFLNMLEQLSDPAKLEENLIQGHKLSSQLVEKNFTFLPSLKKVIEECNLIKKENETLREACEKITDDSEETKQNYKEVFNVLVSNISETNENLINFYKEKKHNEQDLYQFFTKVIERNSELIAKEKELLFSMIPEIEVRNDLGIIQVKDKRVVKKNFKQFDTNEIRTTRIAAKAIFSLKKTLKIIDSIFFEMIEKFYFKKDKVNYDPSENFIDFIELPLAYFNTTFGLENLAKKKYLEFLQSILAYESNSKRVWIFVKMIQINKPCTPFDSLVTRYVISIVQQIKLSNSIIRYSLEDKTKIGLLLSKIPEIVNDLPTRMPDYLQIRSDILTFCESNKKISTLNMRSVACVDFDIFIEFYYNQIYNKETTLMSELKILFESNCSSNKLEPLDFMMLRQYLLVSTTDSEASNFKDSLTFEEFTVICLENDLYDEKTYKEFLKNISISELVNLNQMLQSDLADVYDCIGERLEFLKGSPKIHVMYEKFSKMKSVTLTNEDNVQVIKKWWLSLRMLDELSHLLYVDMRLRKMFIREVNDIYNLLLDGNDMKGNMILKFLYEDKE